MKPTLDTKVRDAQETAQNMEMAASGTAGKLAYSLRIQLDDIVDEVDRMAYEYSVEHLRAGEWLPRENSETHLAEWWDNQEDAEDVAESEYRAYGDTARVVCRLVSQPEVCHEQ